MIAAAAMVLVGPGTRHVAFPARPELSDVPVAAFRMDAEPVTNEEFAAFLATHPEWRRGAVSRLYADEGYLADAATADPRAPVTRVSWFAAEAYCEARGARLPTTDEWELAAQASPSSPDGKRDPSWLQSVLAWYARPAPAREPAVGGTPNYWGVSDLHGLVWEWTYDYSSDTPAPGAFNCGGSTNATGARDDYAAYMRAAFRSALSPDYTVGDLGFRCAADAEAS